MALSTIAITQGVGTAMTVDTSAGGDMQVFKLAESTLGSTALIPASASTGLLVNLGTVSAASVPVTNVGGQNLNVAVVGSVTVTGAVAISGAPAVAQSGGWNIGTVATITNPVTVAGTVAISGTPTVQGTVTGNQGAAAATAAAWPIKVTDATNVSALQNVGGVFCLPVQVMAGTTVVTGTVAATQSGGWNIGTVATITNPVTVTGTVALSGTPTVQGTVTGNQGAAAVVGNAWVVKITDGTNSAPLQNVGGTYSLPVKVMAQVGGGFSQQDKTAFTEGTTYVEVVGGVYNDSFGGSPAAGQASTVRITAQRAWHCNLRRLDGTEIGTSTTPLVVGPAGTALAGNVAQVGGAAVVSAAAGVQQVGIVGATGTAFSAAAPLAVQNGPSLGFWKNAVAFTASQTSQVLRTPTGGKTSYVEGIVVTVTAAGRLQIYDNTNAAGNMIYQGTPPIGAVIAIHPARPIPLAAINNVLRYDTGTGATGDISLWGYEV
jgi:hypothetical protein